MTASLQTLIDSAQAASSGRFRSLAAVLEVESEDEWHAPPASIALTDVLPEKQAKALYLTLTRSHRVLMLGEEAPDPDYFSMVGGSPLARSIERQRAAGAPFDLAAVAHMKQHLDSLCSRLADQVGNLTDKLDRIERDALQAFEEGDTEADLTPDESAPLDLAKRFAKDLAAREKFIARAKRDYPDMAVRIEPLRAFDLESAVAELACGPSRVAVVDCELPDALLYLGFGPDPAVHPRVWHAWGERYGARPIHFSRAALQAFVERPPHDLGEHIRFFAEQAAYNPDTRSDGPLCQLGASYRNALLGFWWD
jgi:hypothetical protein